MSIFDNIAMTQFKGNGYSLLLSSSNGGQKEKKTKVTEGFDPCVVVVLVPSGVRTVDKIFKSLLKDNRESKGKHNDNYNVMNEDKMRGEGGDFYARMRRECLI